MVDREIGCRFGSIPLYSTNTLQVQSDPVKPGPENLLVFLYDKTSVR